MKTPFILLPLLLSSSCWSHYTKQKDFEQYTMQKDADDSQLRAFLAAVACPASIQVSVNSIDAACKFAYQQGGGGSCSLEALETQIEGHHKRMQHSMLLDLMKMMHDVVYLQKNARDLEPYRKARLSELLKVPLLKQTKFRLVTSAKDGLGPAEQRLKIVRDFLTRHPNNPIPVDTFANDLLYNFFGGKYPVKVGDIAIDDRPIASSLESNVPIENGVWIIRMDCPLNEAAGHP